MLAVLSLPLLIVGLYQLYSYRRSLNDQSAAIARTEAEAAAGALESWIESHPTQATNPSTLTPAGGARAFRATHTPRTPRGAGGRRRLRRGGSRAGASRRGPCTSARAASGASEP